MTLTCKNTEFSLASDRSLWPYLGDYYLDTNQNGLLTCLGLNLVMVPIPGKEYHAAAYQVTQAQYEWVMGKNPSWFSLRGEGKGRANGLNTDHFPVERVNWYEANKFCDKLSKMTEVKFFLPTSEQWEYACRAGTTTKYNTGNGEESLKEAGWYHSNSGEITHKVGEKKPNAWGLYDMHGNVWEWTSTPYYKEGENSENPTPSGAAAGTTSAGSAGPRTATGTPPGIASTTSVSGSFVEGENSENPTPSGEEAGSATAGTAGPRTATGAPPGSGSAASVSGSFAEYNSKIILGGCWINLGWYCQPKHGNGQAAEGHYNGVGSRVFCEGKM